MGPRALFHTRVDGINHQEYFVNYYWTVRKHLLKYSDDSLEDCRVRLRRLVLVFEGIKCTVAFMLVLYVLRCIARVIF